MRNCRFVAFVRFTYIRLATNKTTRVHDDDDKNNGAWGGYTVHPRQCSPATVLLAS